MMDIVRRRGDDGRGHQAARADKALLVSCETDCPDVCELRQKQVRLALGYELSVR